MDEAEASTHICVRDQTDTSREEGVNGEVGDSAEGNMMSEGEVQIVGGKSSRKQDTLVSLEELPTLEKNQPWNPGLDSKAARTNS